MNVVLCFQLLLATLTNLSLLPACYLCFKHNDVIDGIIFIFEATISAAYHYCDVWEQSPVVEKKETCQLLSMNAGNWHRLDNVGAILIFDAVLLKLSYINSIQFKEYIRWTSLFLCLITQEISPWNVMLGAIPVVYVAIFAVSSAVLHYKKFNNFNFYLGTSLALIAGLYFIQGLDEKKDWLRINHYIWHLVVGIAIYYLYNLVYVQDKKTPKPRTKNINSSSNVKDLKL